MLIKFAFLCGLSTAAFAVDGVVLIDQNRALAGNVTPGDAPGFPVTISQPGSYRLSGNLVAPLNSGAIHIAASKVTLDLNGFHVQCTNTLADMLCVGVLPGGFSDITVSNGKVTLLNNFVGPFGTPAAVGLNNSTRNIITGLHVQNTGGGYSLQSGAQSILRGNISIGANLTISCPSLVEGNFNEGGFGTAGINCVKVNNAGFFGL